MEGVQINVRAGQVREGRIKSVRYWRMNKRRCASIRGDLLPYYHNCSEQRVKYGGKWHSVFKTLISSLLAVAALKYQGKAKDPFEAKPIVTWCFLVSFFLYCLTILLGLLNNNYSPILFSRMALAFGALSLLSLLSLFLPPT